MADTYVLSTDIGRLRLAIGDTDLTSTNAGVKPNGENLSDDELTAFITDAGDSWVGSVPLVLRALANMYATKARSVSNEGGFKEDYGDIIKDLRENADTWEAKYPAGADDEAFAGANDDDQISSVDDGPIFFGVEQWGADVTDQRPS